MSEPTARALAETAERLARGAGEIHLRWFRALGAGDVRFKSRRDPVTESDLEAERFLVEGIGSEYPRHRILAEEGGAHGGDGDTEWIVDPLDGTVNFSHGIPLYGVAVAVRRRGELVAGVVHAPSLDECFVAVHGEGATLNGAPLRVSETSELPDALLATGFAYRRNEAADDNVGHFNDFILGCRDIRRMGAAALDLAYVAAGRLDAFWELHLQPWDVAAGMLLVREAGGRVTDFDGGDVMIERGDALATNGPLHDTMRAILRPQ